MRLVAWLRLTKGGSDHHEARHDRDPIINKLSFGRL